MIARPRITSSGLFSNHSFPPNDFISPEQVVSTVGPWSTRLTEPTSYLRQGLEGAWEGGRSGSGCGSGSKRETWRPSPSMLLSTEGYPFPKMSREVSPNSSGDRGVNSTEVVSSTAVAAAAGTSTSHPSSMFISLSSHSKSKQFKSRYYHSHSRDSSSSSNRSGNSGNTKTYSKVNHSEFPMTPYQISSSYWSPESSCTNTPSRSSTNMGLGTPTDDPSSSPSSPSLPSLNFEDKFGNDLRQGSNLTFMEGKERRRTTRMGQSEIENRKKHAGSTPGCFGPLDWVPCTTPEKEEEKEKENGKGYSQKLKAIEVDDDEEDDSKDEENLKEGQAVIAPLTPPPSIERRKPPRNHTRQYQRRGNNPFGMTPFAPGRGGNL